MLNNYLQFAGYRAQVVALVAPRDIWYCSCDPLATSGNALWCKPWPFFRRMLMALAPTC